MKDQGRDDVFRGLLQQAPLKIGSRKMLWPALAQWYLFALGETYVIELTYCQPEAPKGIAKMMPFFFQADFLNASLAGLSRAR